PPHTPTPTLSLHDALPICHRGHGEQPHPLQPPGQLRGGQPALPGDDAAQVLTRARHAAVQNSLQVTEFFRRLEHPPITSREYDIDRKSTRLNSSHEWISYA